MPDNRPVVHLICTAHLDPVWMWPWEEGLREAISTFHTAANLLDDFPEFVFNHNESLLYEWTEDHDPFLFRRIQSHIKTGRWNVTGGWYLQPDCNMPSGETLARLILEGRRYFSERFGVRPPVAYNFDSFGHPQSLPQLLRQSGFEMYIHFRPTDTQMELPGPFYRWRGMDGSEILAIRPDTGWYCTPREGQAREQALNGVEAARSTGKDTIVLWGLGDHGGGATRAELEMFREMFVEFADADIILKHSTPEAFLERIKPDIESLPVYTGELQRTLAGTYTSVAPIKQQMRQGEAHLMMAERAAAMAWWLYDAEYPAEDLRTAWKDLMFNTFHDILCGSLVEHAIPGVNDYYGAARHRARKILTRSQHILLPGKPPEADTIPLYIYNPHAMPVDVPLGINFMSAYAPPPEKKPFSLYDDNDQPVACQTNGGPAIVLDEGTWQPFCGFTAQLPAMSVRRYEIRFETPVLPAVPSLEVMEDEHTIQVDSTRWKAVFSKQAGALAQLTDKASGETDLLRQPAQLHAMKDVAHGWGGEDRAVFSETVAMFRALTSSEVGDFNGMEGQEGPAVRVIAQGPAWVTVECLVMWQHSRASVRYTIYAKLPYMDVHVRLFMQARRKMVKMQFPFALEQCQVICEVPYGVTERATDSTEHPYTRWLRLQSDRLTIGIANNGQYGFDVSGDGMLNLSLSRGAVHSAWEEDGIPTDKAYTWMDQQQIDTRFRLIAASEEAEVIETLPLIARTLNQPPDIFFSYFPPTLPDNAPEQMLSFVEVTPRTVVVETLKRAEKGDALVLRLVETAGHQSDAHVSLQGKSIISTTFEPYEIKTFKVRRDLTWQAVNLLEEPLS